MQKKIVKLLIGFLLISIVLVEFVYIYDFFKSNIYGYDFIEFLKVYNVYNFSDYFTYIAIFLIGAIQIGGAFVDGN